MNVAQTLFCKILFCPALFIISVFLLANSFRVTGVVLLLALAGSYFYFLSTARTRLMKLIFVSFLIAVFLPIDVLPVNYPGPPRFIPLVMGMPGPELSARAMKGEVMLGGCIVRGNEPRWIWVW